MSIYIYTHANQQRLLCVRSLDLYNPVQAAWDSVRCDCILYIIKLVKTNKLQCRAREALMSKDGNLSLLAPLSRSPYFNLYRSMSSHEGQTKKAIDINDVCAGVEVLGWSDWKMVCDANW